MALDEAGDAYERPVWPAIAPGAGESASSAAQAARARVRAGRQRSSVDEDAALVDSLGAEAWAAQVREILCGLVQKSGVTKAKKLSFLNTLVKLWHKNPEDRDLAWRKREVMICLRIPLTHDSAEVRAATLRVLRYITTEESDVRDLNRVNIHYLIAKCLDIDLDNRLERVHAVRLARKCLFLAPQHLSPAIVRSLVAVAQGDPKEPDRLQRACLAVLCELCLFNAELFVRCQGVTVLTHALLDCNMPRISEAILGSLLHLYNYPDTRALAKIRLDVIMAPYTGFRYVHHEHAPPDGATNEVEFHFQSAHLVILSALRSWSGLIHLGRTPGDRISSPIRSLVDVLHLNKPDTRKLVILLFFDALRLKPPKNHETHAQALDHVQCNHFQDHWKLTDGFVTSEGLDILPPLANSRPNLLDTHLSLLLYCLLSAKLPEALARVIVHSESPLSVLATTLLGEFLYLAYRLLPREINVTSHCLPPLLDEVTSPDHERALKAQEAVTALRQFHAHKKRGPVANSLLLDQIFVKSSQASSDFMGEPFVGDRLQLSPLPWCHTILKPNGGSGGTGDRLASIIGYTFIHDSKVTTTQEADEWDWDAVTALFKWPTETFLSLEANSVKQFVRRILDFYLPSNDLFAKVDLNKKRAKYLARTGCYFVDFLLRSKAPEATKALSDLLSDISSQIQTLLDASPGSYPNCLLSPNRIGTTCCQHYFLFLGRLSQSEEGRKSLDTHQLLQSMFSMLQLKNEMYLKVIVACLDYSSPDWGSRNLLQKALKETSESCRIYTTKFLGLLIRSRISNVAQWGIEFLTTQLFDASKVIPWIALEFLLEACTDKMNLEAMVCALTPNIKGLKPLGIRGRLLVTLMLSSTNGFSYLSKVNYIDEELVAWAQERNVEYVRHIEELLNDGFSHHQYNLDGSYGRRSQEAHKLRDVFIPPHLYGQLSQTVDGMKIIIREPALLEMIALVKSKSRRPSNSGKPHLKTSDILGLKTAIWALCNVGSSSNGMAFLETQSVLSVILGWAESSAYYSLQGTAYYALSLISTCRKGVRYLGDHNWMCLRYGRDEKWPVPEELFVRQLQAMQISLEGQPISVQEAEKTLFSLYDVLEPEHGGELARFRGDNNLGLSDGGSISSRSDTSSKNLSTRKRLSAMFRSFSLGQKSEDKTSSSGGGMGKKIPAKLRRKLFQNRSFEVDTDFHPEDVPQFKLSLATNDSCDSPILRHIKGATTDVIEVAPIATPDADSDVLLTSPIHSSSVIVVNNESVKSQPDGDLPATTSSSSGVSSEGSTPISRPLASVPISGPAHTLSPIASSSSLSNLKSPAATPKAEGAASRPPPCGSVTLRTRASSSRSGQRTCSESEAANWLGNLSQSEGTPNEVQLASQQESRCSVTSVNSVGSWQNEHNPGYLTLRSIHNKRRPPLMLSDSTDTSALESPSVMTVSHVHSGDGHEMRSFLKKPDPWSRKSRSLDYRILNKMRPRLASQLSNSGVGGGLIAKAQRMLPLREESEDRGPEPQYWGIAMPLNPEIIFPKEDAKADGNNSLLNDDFLFHTNQPHLSTWLKNQVRQSSRRRSSLSTEHAAHFQGLEFHTHSNCLGCLRLNNVDGIPEDELADPMGPSVRPRSGSLSVVCPGSMGYHSEDNAQQRLIQSNQGSPIALRKANINVHRRDRAVAVIGSGESFIDDLHGSNISGRSDVDGRSGSMSGHGGPMLGLTEGFLSKVNQRKEVLKLIGTMNATVGVKTAEQALLKFKQKYPNVFIDMCLYSDVCILLSKYAFRLPTRRFIQELFMDLHFEELYEEPCKLLQLEYTVGAPHGSTSMSSSIEGSHPLSQLVEASSEDALYMA